LIDYSILVAEHQPAGAIMAKRRKTSKVQKRGKLPSRKSAKRGKIRKASKSAKAKVAKRTATAKPKRARVKKPAQKVLPSTLVVETVVVDETTPDAIIDLGATHQPGGQAAPLG
jgi:hypothetical protein